MVHLKQKKNSQLTDLIRLESHLVMANISIKFSLHYHTLNRQWLFHRLASMYTTPKYLTNFQERSRAIATYALCGFSSLSSLAMSVGVWNSICPQKVAQMASSMFRVIVEANISCFMTACIAGEFSPVRVPNNLTMNFIYY